MKLSIMTNIVHIREHKKSNPFGTTLGFVPKSLQKSDWGGGGGWVLNGMRISLISSPNSKEQFSTFFSSCLKFSFSFSFPFVFTKELGVMRSWWGEHLASARVQLVCALVERLKGPPTSPHPHCPSLPPELNSFGPLSLPCHLKCWASCWPVG